MVMKFIILSIGLLSVLLAATGHADEVAIVNVRAECPNTCTFAVTLRHDDEGWKHYANQWDVLTLDGQLIESRVLYHPHVDEQPFTRSLSGVAIAREIKSVKIRARDLKHGYSAQQYVVELPGR